MSYLQAIDVSQWQGAIDWVKVNVPIVIIKMSGGDAGLYMDSKAAYNYDNAVKAGKAVAGYHFGGGTDPIAEADYFLRAMSPLAENDVMILDCEAALAGRSDVVSWCNTFLTHIHDKTAVWPLIYMSLSVLNAHDWTSVLANCGLWIADWQNNPDATISNHTYVMHQYSDAGTVPGIAGRVDLDAWFGTLEQFKKYGYHKPITPPEEAPSEPTTTLPATPVETSQPSTPPVNPPEVSPPEAPAQDNPPEKAPSTSPAQSTQKPTPKPTSSPTVPEKKVIVVDPTYYKVWELIIAILKKIFNKK